MELEQVSNFVADEMKKIMMSHAKNTSDPKTVDIVREKITDFLNNLCDNMNYKHMPAVICKHEKPFLTVNFLSHNGERLATYGDLLYYMSTGSKDSGANNEFN